MSFKTNPYLILFTILHLVSPCLATKLLEESPKFSARALDSLLQNRAFKSLSNPRTGVIYPGLVPTNLTGIGISALRLRSGSLRRRGFKNYSQISIPIGVIEQPYVERLVLVYHDLRNWSTLYYPLPGFVYLAPLLGLLTYDGSNLSADYVPELDIRTTKDPILVEFNGLEFVPYEGSPKCVYFGLDGSVEFDNVMNGNFCAVTKQGHFGIVVEYVAPSPSPTVEPPTSSGDDYTKMSKRRIYECIWVVIVSVIGGGIFVGVLVLYVRKCRQRKKIKGLDRIAQGGVALGTKEVMGVSRVPMAMGTRTKPVLENRWSFEGD